MNIKNVVIKKIFLVGLIFVNLFIFNFKLNKNIKLVNAGKFNVIVNSKFSLENSYKNLLTTDKVLEFGKHLYKHTKEKEKYLNCFNMYKFLRDNGVSSKDLEKMDISKEFDSFEEFLENITDLNLEELKNAVYYFIFARYFNLIKSFKFSSNKTKKLEELMEKLNLEDLDYFNIDASFKARVEEIFNSEDFNFSDYNPKSIEFEFFRPTKNENLVKKKLIGEFEKVMKKYEEIESKIEDSDKNTAQAKDFFNLFSSLKKQCENSKLLYPKDKEDKFKFIVGKNADYFFEKLKYFENFFSISLEKIENSKINFSDDLKKLKKSINNVDDYFQHYKTKNVFDENEGQKLLDLVENFNDEDFNEDLNQVEETVLEEKKEINNEKIENKNPVKVFKKTNSFIYNFPVKSKINKLNNWSYLKLKNKNKKNRVKRNKNKRKKRKQRRKNMRKHKRKKREQLKRNMRRNKRRHRNFVILKQ